jgi:protein-disulfide isomerase
VHPSRGGGSAFADGQENTNSVNPITAVISAVSFPLFIRSPAVRLVEMEFPILGPASIYVAQVALAAWKQVKHAAFRNALMAKEGNMDEGSIQEDWFSRSPNQ